MLILQTSSTSLLKITAIVQLNCQVIIVSMMDYSLPIWEVLHSLWICFIFLILKLSTLAKSDKNFDIYKLLTTIKSTTLFHTTGGPLLLNN